MSLRGNGRRTQRIASSPQLVGDTPSVMQSSASAPSASLVGHSVKPGRHPFRSWKWWSERRARPTRSRRRWSSCVDRQEANYLKQELPACRQNRLQAALYREMLYLTREGRDERADMILPWSTDRARWGVRFKGLQGHLGGGGWRNQSFMDHLMAPLAG